MQRYKHSKCVRRIDSRHVTTNEEFQSPAASRSTGLNHILIVRRVEWHVRPLLTLWFQTLKLFSQPIYARSHGKKQNVLLRPDSIGCEPTIWCAFCRVRDRPIYSLDSFWDHIRESKKLSTRMKTTSATAHESHLRNRTQFLILALFLVNVPDMPISHLL
jgi:hypothetical protein